MSQALQRTDRSVPGGTSIALGQAPVGGVAPTSLDDVSRLADMFAKSGMFPDVRSAHQAGVKILTGAEMGFPPIASMNGVHIVKGKSALGATLIAAAIKRHPGYDFRVTRIDDEACTIEFFELRAGERQPLGESTFTAADAKRAGTQNMGKFPRNMLHSRALTNGVRWYCPDIFSGAVYTPDELGARVNDEGTPIETAEVVELRSVPAGDAAAADAEGRIGFPGEEVYAGPEKAEPPPSDIVQTTADGDGAKVIEEADDRHAEQRRIMAEIQAVLEAVEEAHATGAAPDDVLAIPEGIAGIVPPPALELARLATMAVCRGATIDDAVAEAKAELKAAADGAA